jgi:hypothetical protein
MIKILVLLSFTLLVQLHAVAQHELEVNFTTQDQYLLAQEAPAHYVFGNNVALRQMPTDTAQLLSILNIGQPIILVKRSVHSSTIRGIKSQWYMTSVNGVTGWIWGGNIAVSAARSKANLDVVFLYGYEKSIYNINDTLWGKYCKLRAIKGQTELDNIIVKSPSWDIGPAVFYNNLGLENIDDIIAINVPCTGGCGCTTGEIFVFWNNNKFTKVAQLLGTPDGDYSESTEFVFPADLEGERGYIIRKSSLVLDNGDITQSPEIIKRQLLKQYYVWNGQQLLLLHMKTTFNNYYITTTD